MLLTLTVFCLTGHLWIYMLKRVNCLMNRMLPLPTLTNPSDEQTYRETMRGIRSSMGWMDIPDIDSSAAKSEDNPFAGPKLQQPGKVSVQLPTDEWLCRKLSKLNLTVVEGYPSRSSETGGLQKDQFIKPARPQAKCYRFHSDQKILLIVCLPEIQNRPG